MKKLLLFIFTLLLPLVASADASRININGINYNLSDYNQTAEVTYSTDSKYSGDVVIPETVTYNDNQYRVTSIEDWAFYGCRELTSINIPNSVNRIGLYAFKDCSGLTSITIPSSVTSIEKYTFYGCSGLTSITIPNSVTSIGNEAFRYCSGLTSITIPNSVTWIADGAFYGCTGLTSITISNSYIGENAFYDCYVTKENFHNQRNTIPSGLTVCDVRTESGICIKGNALVRYLGKETTYSIPNSITNIGERTFQDCSGLTSITIPNSVTNIGEYAFCRCTGLTSINIPNSVTNIEKSVFSGCSGLTSITIPNSVTTIGGGAFSGCTGLTSITIPNSVTSIGEYAFYGCTGLTSINIPNSVRDIGAKAFDDCKLSSITVKAKVVPILHESSDGNEYKAFSLQSFYHATLFVPSGSWYDYAYDDNWYTFHTIRETAFAADEVAESRAFTLKDTRTNNYLCYDKVNKSVGTIATEGLNEDEPNNAWMLANVDEKQYIYNLGSKKFLAVARNEAKSTRAASDGIGFILTDEPTPVTLSNGADGISVNGVKEFYFVVNQNLSIDNSVVSKIEETTGIDKLTTDNDHGSVYNLNGQKVNKGYRGIIIKNGKKVITK